MRRLAPMIALVATLTVTAAPASAAPIPGRYIVVLKDSAGDPAKVAAQHERKHGAQRDLLYRHVLKGDDSGDAAGRTARRQPGPARLP